VLILIIALIGIFLWNGDPSGYGLCWFKNIFHIPCPGCGLTRALLCILSGDLKGAFFYNALSIPLFIAFICSAVWIIIDGVNKDDSFNRFMRRRMSKKYIVIIAVITLFNWIWNIKKGI